MKWIVAIAAFALFATVVRAEEVEAEEGDPRLGYITVNSDGSTSLTFNATSIQNAVILGLFIIVLGALLVPLLGGFDDYSSGYGYGNEQSSYGNSYDTPSSGYNTYSKRSAEFMGPVLDALSSAYKKYEEEDEQ